MSTAPCILYISAAATLILDNITAPNTLNISNAYTYISGKADEIECSYVTDGQPTDVNAYIKSKQGFGKSFVDFFSDGGLIKFNPFK